MHDLSAGRPCERRDPSPLASKVKKGLCPSAENEAPRRMGPCVRRDDSLIRHALDGLAGIAAELRMSHPTSAFPSVAGASIGK